MRVTLAVDNLADEGLRSEHGLSVLVEADGGSVLFDTGQSDVWLANLAALGKDPGSISAVVISHGHYDHTGGLARAVQELPNARFFAHQECFAPKYSRSVGQPRYIGMPPEAVGHEALFTLNTSAVEIAPGVVLSGEIPVRVGESFFESRFITGQDELLHDTFEDEQCVVVRGDRATSVLVGCAHRGVENNVLAAMDVAGVRSIDLLVGGFHLGDASRDRLEHLVDFLNNTDIAQVACCHCTGVDAYRYLNAKLGSRVTLARAGMSWEV